MTLKVSTAAGTVFLCFSSCSRR